MHLPLSEGGCKVPRWGLLAFISQGRQITLVCIKPHPLRWCFTAWRCCCLSCFHLDVFFFSGSYVCVLGYLDALPPWLLFLIARTDMSPPSGEIYIDIMLCFLACRYVRYLRAIPIPLGNCSCLRPNIQRT